MLPGPSYQSSAIELSLLYTFRNKEYSCLICIDNSEYPCYVFVTLLDKDLIKEFGDEITIKTDCEKLLPKCDDYKELVELRQAIFDAVIPIPEFSDHKGRILQLGKSKIGSLGHHAYQ